MTRSKRETSNNNSELKKNKLSLTDKVTVNSITIRLFEEKLRLLEELSTNNFKLITKLHSRANKLERDIESLRKRVKELEETTTSLKSDFEEVINP